MPVYILGQLRRKKGDFPGLIWVILVLCFLFALVYEPVAVFTGATDGLKVWWEIIFPSLLPFFIASELLVKLGFVHFLSVLLEPIMRPLFNVPGSGGFVLVMGLVGGAPTNGLLIMQLREKQLVSRLEAERLLCFTHFATPLFMISSVAVGMLGSPELGIIIAGTHYLANIIIGLGLRFLWPEQTGTGSKPNAPSFRKALVSMIHYQRQQRQTIGELLNDAVKSSVIKLQNIGGFIILFSVIISIFTRAELIDHIATGLSLFLVPLGFAREIIPAITSGLFETTIGCSIASHAPVTQLHKVIAIGFMLGWSGLSVHAQVASMVAGTDIGLRLFFFTRIAHAFLVAGLTWIVYWQKQYALAYSVPAFAQASSLSAFPTPQIILYLALLTVCLLIILTLLATILNFVQQLLYGLREAGNRFVS